MFKVVVKSNIRAEVVNRLKKTITDDFVQKIQNEVVDGEIKRLISAGVSPVQSTDGGKRFKGYKNPDQYPANKKAKRPANLNLSGAMLSWYRAVFISGVRVSFGIPKFAPQEIKDRAEGNNVGTVAADGTPAIAARRFIPLKGETFAVSVLRKIKSLYAKQIKDLLSKR